MAGLAEAVQNAVGQPASVRMGVVESLDPVVITVQGTTFDDLGFLDGYTPVEGDTVALLGQSSEAGSDPASWLVLGKVQNGVAEPMQAGVVLFSFTAVTNSFQDVDFEQPYSEPPSVVATIASLSGTANLWFVRVANVSTTGFRVGVSASLANTWVNIPVNWQAQPVTQ